MLCCRHFRLPSGDRHYSVSIVRSGRSLAPVGRNPAPADKRRIPRRSLRAEFEPVSQPRRIKCWPHLGGNYVYLQVESALSV